MIVNKRLVNSIRNGLKRGTDKSKEDIEKIRKLLITIKSLPDDELFFATKKKVVDEVNSFFHCALPYSVSNSELVGSLEKIIKYMELVYYQGMTLASGLSKDGFTGVTHLLPIFALSCSDETDPSFSFLLVSGIKKNGETKKEDDPLMDQLEKNLLNYERRMAAFIDDKYRIDRRQITSFIGILQAYIEFFNKRMSVKIGDKDNNDVSLDKLFINMGLYIVYSWTGIMPSDIAIRLFREGYQNYVQEGFTPGGAVRKLVEEMIVGFEFAKKEISAKEEKKTPSVSKIKTRYPLYDYIDIDRGRVVRECDESEFERMLEESDLNRDQQNEYLAQMRNLKKRNAQRIYEERANICKKVLLDGDERSLYAKAKELGIRGYVDDVDSIFDLLIEYMADVLDFESALRGRIMDIKDEEMREFLNIIDTSFESLRETLVSREAKNEEKPKVIYYLVDVKGEQVPKLLTSVLADKKCDRKRIAIQLNKLLSSLTVGDRELEDDRLPCRVWYKGRDYKIYYAIVDGVTVVIDVSHKDITNMLTGARFKEFLDRVKREVAVGNNIQALKYTDVVMSILDKTHSKNMES